MRYSLPEVRWPEQAGIDFLVAERNGGTRLPDAPASTSRGGHGRPRSCSAPRERRRTRAQPLRPCCRSAAANLWRTTSGIAEAGRAVPGAARQFERFTCRLT